MQRIDHIRMLVPLLCASLASVSVLRPMAGQTPAASGALPVPAALAVLPTPLVTADFPVPIHPVDWSHYAYVDECVSVPAWTHAEAIFDSLDRTSALDMQRRSDTTLYNPWDPLLAVTRDSTQRCLRHFRLAEIPSFEAPALLRLAMTLNADSLMAVLLAQRLAAVHAAPVPIRAAVLDTLIRLLMDSPGLPGQPVVAQPSPAHLQLARTYAAQLTALGPAAIPMRIIADGALIRPAVYADNLDLLLANIRTQTQLLRQVTPEEAMDLYGTTLDTVEEQVQGETALLQWLKTNAPDALARFREAAIHTHRFPRHQVALLGATAAPVTGDYCFAATTTSTPTSGLMPSIPTPGAPSLVAFGSRNSKEFESGKTFAILRRLHQEFPALRIVLVAPIRGYYQDRWLQDQPAEEAALVHQVLADSLGVPGSLCLLQTHYQTLPNGWALPLITPLPRAYDLDVDESLAFLIDPQGHIVDTDAWNYQRYRTLLRIWQQRSPSGGVVRPILKPSRQ